MFQLEKQKRLRVPAPAQLGFGCRPRILAQAEGRRPKDTPEKLKPGGHCLNWSCLLEEASGRQNLPESFLFGNLEPAPL